MGVYALEFQAYVDGVGLVTRRIATRTIATSPSDAPANTEYMGILASAGELKRELFANGSVIGKPGFNYGFFEISNADGAVDDWLQDGIDGRSFTLKYIDDPDSPTALADATTLLIGIMRGFDSTDLRKNLRIRARDALEKLNRPVLTQYYAGTTGASGPSAEGDSSIAGKPKPQSWGFPNLFEPVLVNPFDLIYQVGTNPQLPGSSGVGVIDGNPIEVPTFQAEFASLAALQAATVSPGRFSTCSTLGLFRLGATPAFRIAAAAASAVAIDAGAVTLAMLLYNGVSSGDIETDSFADVTAFSSAIVGLWIDDGNMTVLDAASLLLNSVGCALTATPAGKLQAVIFGEGLDPENPGTPVDTYTLRDIDAGDASFVLQASLAGEGDGVPPNRVVVKHSRYYTTLGRGDLASGVDARYVSDFGKDWRRGTAVSGAISIKHALSGTLEIETRIASRSAAFQQAERLLTLYGVRRDFITITLSADRAGDVNLGELVAIDIDRFGYDGGKNFIVIGRHDKFSTGDVTLTLWG